MTTIIENSLKQKQDSRARHAALVERKKNRVVAVSDPVTVIAIDRMPPVARDVSDHPEYLSAVLAFPGRTIVDMSYRKADLVCDEWHEILGLWLGYYHYERRVVFVMVEV